MNRSEHHTIDLDGHVVDYRLVRSKTAGKLRVRVRLDGIEVVQPSGRSYDDVSDFLACNRSWVLDQLDRTERLRQIRRPTRRSTGEIVFRGQPTRVRIEETQSRAAGNGVQLVDDDIVVSRGPGSRTDVAISLERWLRQQARRQIQNCLSVLTPRIGERYERLYVMDQRTKWGNCSSRRNLSFNWRLILAPDYVLRYLVTHEAVHLAVPDHSAKFWLTVQSLCPETERAKQWLVRHQAQLQVDLSSIIQQLDDI